MRLGEKLQCRNVLAGGFQRTKDVLRESDGVQLGSSLALLLLSVETEPAYSEIGFE